MQYTIDTSQNKPLNWGASGNERILQNVNNLINLWQYEVAYNRTMGKKTRFIDKPLNEFISEYAADLIELIDTFEPRARITDVIPISSDDEGNVNCRVVIEI